MELKRYYGKPAGWEPQRNVRDTNGQLINPHRAPGVLLNSPALDHIEVKNTGASPEQHFSERLVKQAIEDGWMSIEDGALTLYAMPENLTYEILRTPGRYSCFDGSKLPDDEKGAQARAVLAEHHAGEPSPDPANPAGYECINYYDCILAPAQHAKYRNKKGQV